MSKLTLENVSYTYSPDTPFEKEALSDVNIDFTGGKITGIIGHTGSGKSTVAKLLASQMKPTSGRVLLDGKDIFSDFKDIREVRFRVGLVFQYPEYQLFEETVFRDIAYGPTNMGLDKEEIEKRVYKAAGFVGLERELLDRSPFDLSGGQKRRCAIAGIMAMEPDVIILDEPAAGLDPRGRDSILGGIREYQRKNGNTVIIISHSMEDMAVYADEIAVMKGGRCVLSGSVSDVFKNCDVIEDAGLKLPEITHFANTLYSEGICDIRGSLSVEEAFEKMQVLLGSKKC